MTSRVVMHCPSGAANALPRRTVGTAGARPRAAAMPRRTPLRVAMSLAREKGNLAETQGGEASSFANQLEALRSYSTVVADTGDITAIDMYKPQDATTNPSLILKACQMPEYQELVGAVVAKYAELPVSELVDKVFVEFGCRILEKIPGRVSTEVDARLSYDTDATCTKALALVEAYEERGVCPDRFYIKVAATWEGILACRRLEELGINTNMTLIFSFAQAAACAEAGASLVSPFVGRIMDWYKREKGVEGFAPDEDPGVAAVRRVYGYYKTRDYKTIVMAASFRNADEIRQLAGCDKITIAPALLEELEGCTDPLPRMLSPEIIRAEGPVEVDYEDFSRENVFRKAHARDRMAVEKLEEGIRGFVADQEKLEGMLEGIRASLGAASN